MKRNLAPRNNVFYRVQNWSYPKIDHGQGIYLYDDKGKEYIDGCSGSAVANIGHGNKEIAAYAKEQIERIAYTHLSRWTVDTIENCASQIATLTPGDLNHVYFVSGGSEATEAAMKMARQYFIEKNKESSKWKIISKWNSFHGNTIGSLSMTGVNERRTIYDPYLINFPKIPQFYHYRNDWDVEDPVETSKRAAAALEKEILYQGPENVAAFITEPVVGSAVPGIHPKKIYFKMIREICDKYNILLIVDEVMTGFGRTGKMFAIEHYGIVPDILCIAKGMSCGYSPIGGVVARDRVFNRIMTQGSGVFKHGHTYGGNPLSCGIANKVMDILLRENYVENAAIQGDYMLEQLQDLYKYDIVGDIRGKGLLLGIEFVENKKSKKPFSQNHNVKNRIMKECFKNGLIVYPGGGSVDGVRGDHILLAPPLTTTKEEIDKIVALLDQSIKSVNFMLKEYMSPIRGEIQSKKVINFE